MQRLKITLITLVALGCAFFGSVITMVLLNASPTKELPPRIEDLDSRTQQPEYPNRAPSGTATLYGILTNIDDEQEGSAITIKLVEWVEGADNQEQTAIEDGVCTLEMAEQDYCVPGGFYVRKTQKTLVLPISQSPTIRVMARDGMAGFALDAQNNIHQTDATLAELELLLTRQEFSYIPFIVTTSGGKIVSLQEQYLP